MIHPSINKIDYNSITLRRVQLIQERQEQIFIALYAAIVAVFIGLVYMLYCIRGDLDRIAPK